VQTLPPALAPLAAYHQFILYVCVPSKRPGKVDKLPVDPTTCQVANAHTATHWTDFATASTMAEVMGAGYGVGFVFTAADPFWFLDVDNCLVDGVWSAVAQQLCAELQGAAIEVSQSGRGLHIFGTGPVPPHGCKNIPLGLEFYHELRFVALTGINAIGSAAYAPPSLPAVVQRFFPLSGGTNGSDDPGWWSDAPVASWRGPTDDTLLIERALRSASAGSVFGDRARFADLWTADAAVLQAVWPSDTGYGWDASSADAALAQHLAFWTGNDAERMVRLMRQSALQRDKWDARDDYLPRTVRKACSMQTEWLQDAPAAASPFQQPVAGRAVQQEAMRIVDKTILHPDEQVTFFAGCVYVSDEHKVMVPDGTLLDAGRFNARFGGRSFVMDAANTRLSRKAFEAFTESQVYQFPRADTTCFRPLRRPGEIIHEGGLTLVNRWVPIQVPRATGDASRFWRHLEKMIPDENDRMILVGYMAACVQHQGHKFQWAPLIQGTTGNGKSLLANFVKRAIGKRYCHSPRAKNIDNDFNAWLDGNTLYSVDEIYIEDKRKDVLETLKPMISEGDGLEVTKKGVDSATRDVCGNFMFTTNHRAAMRKDRHDRRIAPFFTAQQEPEHLERDGLTEAYFEDFVDWLKATGKYKGKPTGYSIIAELLWTWTIPHVYDPRFHPRAPQTTSTLSAIEAGLGRIEQEVMEAIEQGEPGFKGGWVSSLQLRRVIERTGRPVALSMHAEIMATLGYILHPMLKAGRVNNPVMPDAGRPRLYVRRTDTKLIAIGNQAEIAASYSSAQLA
jgi:hypothetical protein